MLKSILLRIITFLITFTLSLILLTEITFRLLPGEMVYNIAASVNPFHFIGSFEALLVFYVSLSLFFALLLTRFITNPRKNKIE